MMPINILHGFERTTNSWRTTSLVSTKLSDAILVFPSPPTEARLPSRCIFVYMNKRFASLNSVHFLQHVSHRPKASFLSATLPAFVEGESSSLPLKYRTWQDEDTATSSSCSNSAISSATRPIALHKQWHETPKKCEYCSSAESTAAESARAETTCDQTCSGICACQGLW